MDQTLSLSQSELNLLSMTTQWFDKMINYSNSSEWLKYIVSKIWDFLLFERWYVMLIDIGNSKLRQISDPSSMDINFNEKVNFFHKILKIKAHANNNLWIKMIIYIYFISNK